MMPSDPKCKVCRRVGEKLFLKGERCFSSKCAVVRKPYPPGIHTRTARRGGSEFSLQLREKQKLQKLFQISERQFRNYVLGASQKTGDAGENLLITLERRLDNAVFQAGFAQSRSIARQMVSHGNVLVNGKPVTVSSYMLRPKDIVSLSERTKVRIAAGDSKVFFKKYTPPQWLNVDKENWIATIFSLPTVRESTQPTGTKRIIEYYSR